MSKGRMFSISINFVCIMCMSESCHCYLSSMFSALQLHCPMYISTSMWLCVVNIDYYMLVSCTLCGISFSWIALQLRILHCKGQLPVIYSYATSEARLIEGLVIAGHYSYQLLHQHWCLSKLGIQLNICTWFHSNRYQFDLWWAWKQPVIQQYFHKKCTLIQSQSYNDFAFLKLNA